MFGLSAEKILLLAVLALLILGPQRLPEYAAQLARFIKSLKRMAENAQTQVKSELGEGFEDLDWRKLDPRQYDPRRIVREALMDESPPARVSAATVALNRPKPVALQPGESVPFDTEAT
jgi:sec-independent protein translocase protein TatB